ncbi:MAG: acyl-CoA dehydrogenase C-terminal domain-containing protein, partial [Paracoccaceae bacterium]|nr:acyl-CoA dehydrogenase C-terminal domain-containing protein [Paracoccaceae bacterium]
GYMWAQMAKVSMTALEEGASDAAFHETKIATGRYYMARQLPATTMHLARIQSGADPLMALAAEQF